ncbi:hypothetical protein SAMN04487906_2865 [Zhouia amylolytica]|uniref:Uncharacterized protein n=1 Tax=Zhouia amylolytica TaxID=376730 RepID=A0A1I6V4S3_9FLAO|nr:hypothetical protein SAMN04487906_2865 [Zhouia amylolytica]
MLKTIKIISPVICSNDTINKIAFSKGFSFFNSLISIKTQKSRIGHIVINFILTNSSTHNE